MIQKARFLAISIILLVGIIFIFAGFKHYFPNPVKHPVNPSSPDSPIEVFIHVSGNVLTMLNSSEGSAISAIGEASKFWSMFSTNSNLNITFFGKNHRFIPFSFEDVSCEEDDLNNLQITANSLTSGITIRNEIIATSEDDPDCTGPACTHLWTCEEKNEITRFDIQLNLANFDIRAENVNNNVYDLKTLIAHHVGHATGLNHCSVGDTIDSCSNKLSGGMSDPTSDSMMHKSLMPGLIKNDISDDDRAGVLALYGEISPKRAAVQTEMQGFLLNVEDGCPCSLPENETDPRYVISTEESNALTEHEVILNEKNLNSQEKRKEHAQYYQKLHLNAYSNVAKPAERYLVNGLNNMNDNLETIPIERLRIMRKIIICNIDEKKYILDNLQYELDPRFYAFTQAEMKLMIQIRKAIINEIASR